jgi:type I restriction enzyme S subunit
MQRYDEYKESGIEWIGDIPEGWNVYRYKNILTLEQGQAFKSSEYVDNSNVISVRMGNIKKEGHIDLNHKVKYLPEEYIEKYSKYQLFENDLIIAMTDMSPSLDFLAVPAFMQGLNPNNVYLLNQRVGKIILQNKFDIRYVKYLLLSYQLREQLKSIGLGTVQSNMSNEDLYNTLLVAPNKTKQIDISNFLDKKTTEIDKLITQKEQLLALYEEEKAGIINQAVTKGIDPDVTMKESGVPWIGKIPEHWEVRRIGYSFRTIGSGTTPKTSESSYYNDGDITWLNTGDLNNKYIYDTSKKITDKALEDISTLKIYPTDSLVIAMYGATIGKLGITKIKTTVNQACCVLNNSDILRNKYLFYWLLLNKRHIITLASGGGQPNISQEIIRNLKVQTPPIEEQDKIIVYIEQEFDKIEENKKRIKQLIKLQKEYRTALISEVVTGKIKVPEEF